MKRSVPLSTMLMVAGSLLAADSTPKEEIVAAAQKLGDKASYSWHSETVVPEGTEFRPGPIDGKPEKDGFTHITWSIFDNEVEIARKGEKAAHTDQDGAWQLADEQAGTITSSGARVAHPQQMQVRHAMGIFQSLRAENALRLR